MHHISHIIDRNLLIRNGRFAQDRRARRLCLEALEEALDAVGPARSVKAWLRLGRGRIRIREYSIAIPSGIRVLAVGKAGYSMLAEAMRTLGNHVTTGILVVPNGKLVTLPDQRITTFQAGHPIPDKEGFRASRYVLDSIGRMHANELLLCLISGGASAMLPAPAPGITLGDKRRLTQLLIHSKASIHEVNTVRRHLSELKGGRLIERCGAGRIISLIISDVSANSLCDIASGLTAPDPTTYRDAANVLKELKLWDVAPRRIRIHLERGTAGDIPETPKPGDRIFQRVRNVIVADNRTACEAAKRGLNSRHLRATILTSSVDMEARSLGTLMASIANDTKLTKITNQPQALVLGGETTVDVKGQGKGGRNQEVALTALTRIAGLKGVAIATLGTDGIDGNSPAAGALIDGQSMVRATGLRLEIQKFLARNDSYNLFRKLGDSIVTGRTGTNVGDIYLIVAIG